MPSALLLRFDAPLMSFGGVLVDEHGFTEEVPSRSMLTGLLANALGYDHRDVALLERLQERLLYAVRCDRPGRRIVDYQTVDLGQESLREGWTTWGRPESRGGGSGHGTHIRFRHYWADAVYTVALRLEPEAEEPVLAGLEAALHSPERPLFLGRKCCLPAAPLALGSIEAASLREALLLAPAIGQRGESGAALKAWWPPEEGAPETGTRLLPMPSGRDWANQVHTGQCLLREGLIAIQEGAHAE